MFSFQELDLSPEVLRAISELGFETPSKIQHESIPILLEGDRDFIGLAQTGTGKTAAFGLPLLHHIDTSDRHTQALILAPTRELGKQISEQIELYSKYIKGLSCLAVYGGTNITKQIRELKKTKHIIIATPGRLIDLLKRKAVDLESIQFVILDEADEMLNMGFKDDIDHILSHTPEEKKTWLFSATMPKAIRKIVSTYMDKPREVKLNLEQEVNKDISHQYAVVKSSNKRDALCRMLDTDPEIRGVVFCRTRLGTQRLAEELLKLGYKVDGIHGDLNQTQRDRVMQRFKAHHLQLLIATDVAARGIDVNDLTHVFHYQLPDDLSYYTHRSGRTGRAGKQGISLAFINSREKSKVKQISSQLKINFDQIEVPSVADVTGLRMEKWSESILSQGSTKKIDKDLLDQVTTKFGNLSKDELIAKLLAFELDKLNLEEIEKVAVEHEEKRDRSGSRKKKSFRKKDGKRFFKKKGPKNKKSFGKKNKKKKKRY